MLCKIFQFLLFPVENISSICYSIPHSKYIAIKVGVFYFQDISYNQ